MSLILLFICRSVCIVHSVQGLIGYGYILYSLRACLYVSICLYLGVGVTSSIRSLNTLQP